MDKVEAYLRSLPEDNRQALQRIRSTIRKKVPEAEECISYGMPAFRYKNHYFMGYFAFKNHMSLFPSNEPIAKLKDKLTDFKTSKGTIQFTLDNQIPEKLLIELINARLAQY